MTNSLPEKFVKKEELNSLFDYKYLDSYPLINQYLGEKIKAWIENLANPFEIRWIRDLFNGKLNSLEEKFKNLENKMTSSNLKQMLQELPINSKEPVEFVRKIKSIAGEINIYEHLKGEKGFETVEKISQTGDFKCNDEITVSVKRKESIVAPYEYVENIIKALAYVEENEIIRKYNKISLNKLDKLGYRHLNLIYKYLRNYLLKDLIESDKKLKNGTYCDETKSISIYNNYDLKLEISRDPGSSYQIEITLYLDNTKNVEIKFDSRFSSLNIFGFTTDKDAFFEGEKIEIKEYIEDKIDEVCRKEKKPDILWIDVLLHPCYEKTIKSIAEQIYFKDIINSKKYVEFKTILSFTTIFGEEPVILESG